MNKTLQHRARASRALTPVGRRREAARQRELRRRRTTEVVWRAILVLGVVAAAATLIIAFRATGPERASSSAAMVATPAPDFTLKTTDGTDVSLSQFRGEKNVLLFFNEGYGCAPCWEQTALLQRDQQTFADMDVEVFAVMVDQPSLIKSEMSRWGLKTIPILVDQSTQVSKSYDALGGMHANKPDHKFVLVSREGLILWAEDYPSMSVGSDAVVRQVRELVMPLGD